MLQHHFNINCDYESIYNDFASMNRIYYLIKNEKTTIKHKKSPTYVGLDSNYWSNISY